MIDYSRWPRKRISVKSLKLDPENPRLSGFGNNTPTQPQILEYLMEHEDILSLSKRISSMGFLINEEPIVFKEDNKYIVVEGNRRVSACKILDDPDILPKKSNKKKSVMRLLNEFDAGLIKTLTVYIAPNRESADVLIVNRHTDGSAVEKWDKTKQDRFFARRFKDGLSIEDLSFKFNLPKSAIKDSLTRYNFFEELLQLKLDEKSRAALEDETKFSITNVERFYKSKKGREFLGIDINSKGNIIHHLPKDEYHKRLVAITNDVVTGKLNSRTYGDDALQSAYLSKLTSHSSFDSAIIPSRTFEVEYTSETEIPESIEEEIDDQTSKEKVIKNLSTKASANKLIPPIAINWRSGNPRIDKIFKELKEGNLNEQFNAMAVLFRSYLDMVVYQFLNKQNEITELMKLEQQKIDSDNTTKITRVSKYLVSLGIKEEDINIADLKKAMSIKTGVGSHWVPSLKQMLQYVSSSESLVPDIKLRQALKGYINGHDDYLGHNDFNLLVHNEYYSKGKKELKETWDQLYPILAFMHGILVDI